MKEQNRQRKILMVLMGLNIGGAETHVVGLAATLQKMGWEVQIASAGGIYEQELTRLGIRHFQVPADNRSLRSLREAYVGLEKIILREKPDIVHAHARIPGFLCGKLHKKYGFPFVTTAHWTFKVTPLLRFMTDWGQQTIAVSEDIRDYLIENYDLPAKNIHVTINGIDTQQFSPEVSGERIRQELKIPPDAPVVACVTRLHESRAQSALELADIAERLAARLPGLRIVIAGDGECLPQLQQQAAAVNERLGYECLLMLGARKDIAEIVRAGNVFVGVSRAALEAMSCGVPVILCGNEGHGGLVMAEYAERYRATNYCCRDYPASSPELLEKDILQVMAMEPEERNSLGAAGRAIVLDGFSLETMALDCERAYECAMNRQSTMVVSGYYGYDNMGDEAILQRITEKFGRDYRLLVLSKQPAETMRRYPVEAVYRFAPLTVRKAIRTSDAVLSGGGSLLQNRTSRRSLWYYLWVIRQAEHYGKKTVIYANGVGPISGRSSRAMTGHVLNAASQITVRDEDSAEELRRLGVTGQITVTADPVFTMPRPEEGAGVHMLESAGILTEGRQRLLGVSLRSMDMSRRGILCCGQLLDQVCGETGCVPVFLCMQQPTDLEMAQKVQAVMKTAGRVLTGCNTAEEMIRAISAMEAVVSMRLHPLIFAAVAGTPMAGFAFDPKVTALLRDLDMPVLDMPERLNQDTAVRTIVELIEDRAALSARLLQRAAEKSTLASETDHRLLQFLKASKTAESEKTENSIEAEALEPLPSILHLIGGGDSGGAKTHVLSILQGLQQQSCRVHLVCFRSGEFATEAEQLGIPMTVLPKMNVVSNLIWLRRYIVENDVGIVHCHGAKGNMFGAMLGGFHGIRVVTTVHSDPSLDYLGRPFASIVFGRINLAALRKISYQICVSDALRELLEREKIGTRKRFVMYNGISFEKADPPVPAKEYLARFGISKTPGMVIFGTAARLSPVKDISTMIRAFAGTVSRFPEARLMIGGDGEELEKLKKLSERLCPRGTVVFTGWLHDTDSFYGAIDVNVLSSLSEGFPYVLPEGGRRYCASISTDVGGIPEIITDGETGLLFAPGDVETLTAHMCRMIEQPEERKRLADALYMRTKTRFSLENNIQLQMDIYRRILADKGE